MMLDADHIFKDANYYSQKLEEQLKACIHCGMCLPACPTYKVTGNEGQSPRGRLYLINNSLNQESSQSELGNKALEYLDNCLSCYACETVCPSGVEYGSILDYARHSLHKTNYNKGFWGFIRKFAFAQILPNRKILNLLRSMYNRFSFLIPLKTKPSLNKAYSPIETGVIYKSDEIFFDVKDDDRTIVMPLGCLMDTFFNDVHHDTIYVLNRFGYHVFVPELGCCGALASHSGEAGIGQAQLNQLMVKLSNYQYPIVMNSAGCGAFLKENVLDLKILDLVEALNSAPKDPISKSVFGDAVVPEYSALDITYHPACHLNHRQGLAYDYLKWLRKIPNITIRDLPDADTCCGSAGIYNLIKPKMAEQIGKLKAENIKSTQAPIVATANPGCMTQIQSALGEDYKVLHPVSILADYLRALN